MLLTFFTLYLHALPVCSLPACSTILHLICMLYLSRVLLSWFKHITWSLAARSVSDHVIPVLIALLAWSDSHAVAVHGPQKHRQSQHFNKGGKQHVWMRIYLVNTLSFLWQDWHSHSKDTHNTLKERTSTPNKMISVINMGYTAQLNTGRALS